jgi:pimeloyl-ACP methyl ester carboxylesterase
MSVNRETRDVTVREVRIRALEAGRGNGPPLLLIHGLFVTHAEWDDVIDELARKFHVIAPDLPGFGDSAKPSPSRFEYGVEAFAEAMADLVAAFNVGRVHVIGHSLGGAVALTLAAEHAELVQRLVVVDPLSYPFPMSLRSRLPLYPLIGPFIFKQLYGRGMFRAYFRDEVFSKGTPINLARVDEFYDKFNTPAARESAYATFRSMLDTRTLIARLGRVRSPTLVVWGREDKLFPASHASRLAKELMHARLEIMDAGHSPAEEQPEAFLAVVSEFLEGRR